MESEPGGYRVGTWTQGHLTLAPWGPDLEVGSRATSRPCWGTAGMREGQAQAPTPARSRCILPGPDVKAGVRLLHCSEAPPTLVVASVSVSGGLSSHRSLGEQGRRACPSPAPQPLTPHTSVPQSPPSEVPHCSRDTTAWQRGPQQEGPTPSRTLAFCSHRPLLASHCPPGKLSQPVTPSPWATLVSVCGPVEVGPMSE